MQDRVDFAYNFQSLYIRLFLSKFGNYETKLIIGIQRFDRYLYSRRRSNGDLITDYMDVHTFLWFIYLLQRYQLPSIVIHRLA